MKYRKKIMAAVLACMLMLSLGGCGRMTTEKLVAKMVRAAGKTPMTGANMTLDLGFQFQVMGMTMDMSMNADMDMVFSSDPYQMYSDSTMKMNMLGQDITQEMETYVSVEDGKAVSYSHTELGDFWIRQEIGLPEQEKQDPLKMFSWLGKKPLEKVTLGEEKMEYQGGEVYILSCSLTGEELRSFAGQMEGMGQALDGDALEQVDLHGLTVPAELWVDAESFLPVRMEVSLEGLDEMIKQAVEKQLGEAGALEDIAFTISTARITVGSLNFDPVEVPQVPQEGIDRAVDAD